MALPILGPIIDIVNTVVDRVIPDPVQKAQLQLELAKLADQAASREHDEMMGQIGTNTEEAKSGNLFVSGWRPAVGWIGAFGVGYSCVLNPVMNWTAAVIFHYQGNFPILNTDQLFYLVTGMLGFGGLRTLEKLRGVPDSSPTGSSPTGSTNGVPSLALTKPKKKILGVTWPF